VEKVNVIYEVLGHFVEIYMKLMDDGGFGFFRFMQWVRWYVVGFEWLV
jgi:hypothetical protein